MLLTELFDEFLLVLDVLLHGLPGFILPGGLGLGLRRFIVTHA